jgi:hypothetical protein
MEEYQYLEYHLNVKLHKDTFVLASTFFFFLTHDCEARSPTTKYY